MKEAESHERRRRCRDRLRQHGLRVTRSRLAVYDALCQSHDHPTAEELYHRLRDTTRGASMATVYNCLEALSQTGLVGRLDAAPGAARYEAETEPHHHLICQRCGRVLDVFHPALDRLKITPPEGFAVESHTVHFYGLCAECQRIVDTEATEETPRKAKKQGIH